MHHTSTHTSAKDTARWPAYNESAARAVLDDPFAGEIVKNASRLILGGMDRNNAVRAACILANDRDHSTFAMENRLRGLLHDAGVTA